jgi:lysophospholipase L1-like esterase
VRATGSPSGTTSGARGNGGIAGEISQNGGGPVQDYLALFLNARYFVIVYGTNDLGTWPEVETTSPRIGTNHDRMVRAVRDGRRKPILLSEAPSVRPSSR